MEYPSGMLERMSINGLKCKIGIRLLSAIICAIIINMEFKCILCLDISGCLTAFGDRCQAQLSDYTDKVYLGYAMMALPAIGMQDYTY